MPVEEIFPLLYRGCKGYNPCNNLQIKFISNLMVKSVALQLQGYPIEEIRKIFKVEDPKWTLEELVELQKIKDENARRKELQKIKDEIARLMSQLEQLQKEEIRKIFKVEDSKWALEELVELPKIRDENARRKELQKIKDEIVRLMSQRESSQRQGG